MTTPKTRTQRLDLIGAACGLGFTIGPALAGIGLAVSHNNYQLPALMAAALSLRSLFLTLYWFQESHPATTRQQHAETQVQTRGSVKWPVLFVILLLDWYAAVVEVWAAGFWQL